MTNTKSKMQQYEDAAVKLASLVAWELEGGNTLSTLSLDAAVEYRAARDAWFAEIDAQIAAKREAA